MVLIGFSLSQVSNLTYASLLEVKSFRSEAIELSNFVLSRDSNSLGISLKKFSSFSNQFSNRITDADKLW